jgi:hypothetical protein
MASQAYLYPSSTISSSTITSSPIETISVRFRDSLPVPRIPFPFITRVNLSLTTQFSFPPWCTTDWFLANETGVITTQDDSSTYTMFAVTRRLFEQLQNQRSRYTSCIPGADQFPDGELQTWSLTEYRPGICPYGFTTDYQVWRTESYDSFAVCCPEYVTEYSSNPSLVSGFANQC